MPFCTWFQDDQIWACMDPGLDFGGPDIGVVGCDVSCWPCDDVNGLRIGADIYGQRWIRPSLGHESRDAHGKRVPILSDAPTRLPRGVTHFELATCWSQSATGAVLEFFTTTICECTDQCTDDLPDLCSFLEGFIHSCYLFEGFGWKPATFICTSLTVGHAPLLVRMSGGGLGRGASARATNDPAFNTICTSNMGVFCWGHTVGSDCSQPPNWPDYYNTNPNLAYSLWDYAHVTSFAPRFVVYSSLPADYKAAAEAKNKVLEFVGDDIAAGSEGIFHLDQIESARRFASPAANWNALLDLWGRGWEGRLGDDPGEWVDFAALPAVMEFPNSYLANSGHALIAEYVIASASIQMSMVLHRLKKTPPCAANPRPAEETSSIYPMVNMTISVHMAMRVRFRDDEADPHYLQRTWLDPPDQVDLLILGGYDRLFPRISSSDGQTNLDRIVYKNAAGTTLAPPPLVTWKGHMGFFSDPPTEDRFHYTLADKGVAECTAIAAGLEGMKIPAMESHPDRLAGDRKRVWSGDVGFVFPWRDYL